MEEGKAAVDILDNRATEDRHHHRKDMVVHLLKAMEDRPRSQVMEVLPRQATPPRDTRESSVVHTPF